MSADQMQSVESVKSELTKQAFGDKSEEVDKIRKELAKSVFDARAAQVKGVKATLEKRDALVNTIDGFWSKTLEKSAIDNWVEESDREALSHLESLKITWSEEDPRDYTVTFKFSEKNPYFSERELSKACKVPAEIKKEMPYDLDAPVASEAVKISWSSEDKNLVKKSPRPDVTQLEEYDEYDGSGSFFNFFTESDDIGILEQLLLAYENALDIYAGIADLMDGVSDDDEDDEDEEDDDDEEEVDLGDSETDMPKKKKQKN